MAAIGTDTITSISRQHVFPDAIDMVYTRNVLWYRLNAGNKRYIGGATQLEWPFIYADFTNGGAFSGFDVLDVSPNDTVKNGVLEWCEYYSPVSVSQRALVRAGHAQAIASLLSLQMRQSALSLADNLGTDLYSTGSDTNKITGLEVSIDTGSVQSSYAGIAHSGNSWIDGNLDTSTATQTFAFLNSLFGNCKAGGTSPSMVTSRVEQYNRYWSLCMAMQTFDAGVGGHDEQLGSAGFTNLLFNNVPWVDDAKVSDGPNASNSDVYMLNEDFIALGVQSDGDFYMDDFQRPINQKVYVSILNWIGQLINFNPAAMGKATALTA